MFYRPLSTRIADKVTKKDWNDRNLLGGHIWHTTGSGKTLTSFKSAQLIASWHDADKVIFLVDRKALGTQSFDDYRGFASQGDVIQDTANTEILVSKLKSDHSSDTLIITSIQKLSSVTKDAENIKAADLEKIMSKRIVIIVDEAHRSTFGEMLTNIKSTFRHAILFGFTGTPIQDVNSKKDNTTTTVFGDELHRYTLADGIRDKNVLGFDTYMVQTYEDRELREQVALMKAKAKTPEEALKDKKKAKIFYHFMDQTKVAMAGENKENGKYKKGIEDYIPKSQYEDKPEHREAVINDILKGWVTLSRGGLFHAILATSSIPEAVQYYRLLKSKAPQLNITAVFDPNIDNEGGGSLDKEDGIVEILEDYREKFSQTYTLATYDEFREDVQLRIAHKKPYNRISEDQQINIMIVVNQMLTGFDSKWINTLYLDKVMEYENLIQAFSRTNRLFGDEKPFGIIKYYRYPHTMERNIKEAVKAYSGDIPTGLFVDKLPGNLKHLNSVFTDIKELFENAGIDNFEKLPEEMSVKRKFVKLFKQFNSALEAAQIQGFNWEQSVYTVVESDNAENYITTSFEHTDYLALVQRYKELSSGGGGVLGGEPPFDIDTHITEINTDAIDADYMNSRFDKYLKLLNAGDCDAEALEKTLADLHKSFAMLGYEEQKYANLFIRDVQAGMSVDPSKTFRDYISDYMKREEEARIARIVRRLGCNADMLRELMSKKVTSENIDAYGRFNDLLTTVDTDKARRFFVAVQKDTYRESRLKMHIDSYLRAFVLSGGIDPYADIHDIDKKTEKKTVSSSPVSSDSSEECSDEDGYVTTSVKGSSLNQWYLSSDALSCLMNTGCFAYVEDKVCLNEDKYIQRVDVGTMRLTDYAKTHEEECFLQFQVGEDGSLHYVKLPGKLADKQFRYYEHISDDILKQFGLVNEISNQMLEAIHNLEFGPALKELMSKRICGYSINLLRETTGLDNNTVNGMWNGKNLTKVNVVSACLGIHLPFPVSDTMLKLANIIFAMDRPPESNKTYIALLSARWASDYEDIYKDLKEQHLESLIKKPPKPSI